MAVTLTAPNTISTLSSAIFTLANSDTGTAPEQINAGYQVKDGSSNNLTVVERMPNTGDTEKYDVSNVLGQLVSTPFPGAVTNVTAVSEYSAAYSISYGTITFDSSDCSTTQLLNSSTTGLQVVNAYLEPYEAADDYDSGDLKILSYKPNTTYVGPGQSDYLYFYRKTGSVYALATVYYTDGTTQQTSTSITLNGSAGYISCGPANLFTIPTKPFVAYEIEIYSDVGLTTLEATYTFKVDELCAEDLNATTLFFLNPKGGWESIEFSDHSIGGSRDVVQYRSPTFSDDISLSVGGIQEADIRTGEVISLARIMDTTEGLGEFVSAMVRSRDFYVRYFKGGQFRLARAHMGTVTNNPVTAKQTSLQVSVILNNPS